MSKTKEQGKHTPGPWHNNSKNFGYTAHHVCGPHHADGGDYAPICVADTEANARLIAAAPELLEACKKALAFYNEFEEISEQSFGQWGENRRKVRAAIAKAEGRG